MFTMIIASVTATFSNLRACVEERSWFYTDEQVTILAIYQVMAAADRSELLWSSDVSLAMIHRVCALDLTNTDRAINENC